MPYRRLPNTDAARIRALKAALKKGVVKFFYQKLNGEIRCTWGTLKEDLIPETKGTERKKNDSLITYYDNEKAASRTFQIANLIKVGLLTRWGVYQTDTPPQRYNYVFSIRD